MRLIASPDPHIDRLCCVDDDIDDDRCGWPMVAALGDCSCPARPGGALPTAAAIRPLMDGDWRPRRAEQHYGGRGPSGRLAGREVVAVGSDVVRQGDGRMRPDGPVLITALYGIQEQMSAAAAGCADPRLWKNYDGSAKNFWAPCTRPRASSSPTSMARPWAFGSLESESLHLSPGLRIGHAQNWLP